MKNRSKNKKSTNPTDRELKPTWKTDKTKEIHQRYDLIQRSHIKKRKNRYFRCPKTETETETVGSNEWEKIKSNSTQLLETKTPEIRNDPDRNLQTTAYKSPKKKIS